MNASRSEYQLLTPAGPAAIAVVRINGAAVPAFVAQCLRTRRELVPALCEGLVAHCNLLGADGAVLDDIVVIVDHAHPAWDLRLHLHGGPGLLTSAFELLDACGFIRQHDPPRDLWQTTSAAEAENLALLPQMLTLRGVRWLLSQRHNPAAARSVAFRRFATPTRIVLAGPTNAGKSTLINRLAGDDIAIVSATPGTTRDWLEAPGEIDGFPVLWLDTAGLRTTSDLIESEGIRRTLRLITEADCFVLVLDESDARSAAGALAALQPANRHPAIIVLNKSDLRIDSHAVLNLLPAGWDVNLCEISAATGAGIESFVQSIRDFVFPNNSELNTL